MRRKGSKAPTGTRHAPARLEIKALDDDGSFAGYGSMFGNVDSYDEIVAAGAFAASLEEHGRKGTMPAMLWQHDPGQPIGVYTEMREDARGLFVEGKLALDVERGRDAYALLKMKAVSGLSIGFMPRKSEYDEETGIRTLTEVDLWEVSVVTFPANDAARVDTVKAADIATPRDLERYLREAGISRKDARDTVSRVTRYVQRDAERRQLIQAARDAAARLHAILKS